MKTLQKLSLLVSVLIFLFLGCSKDPDDEILRFELNVSVTPDDGGTVSPLSGTYDEGTVVALEGTPSTGYSFVEWTGSIQSTDNPVSITMDSDKDITGVFEKLDSDEDGVTDDLDTCPDTPSGAQVDENGCSNSQIDTDGDGVTDDLDTCPETPGGAQVDENGCSNSQIDSDGDGVTDDLDTCPDTPSGAQVDENGCSDSQKDTDGDGVTDDVDLCSDTPPGENVDENGCPTSSPIYLDGNGITIKCYNWSQVGDTGQVNGTTYTVVDEDMLRQMVANSEDVTKVCTTKVTDMSEMFWVTQFNQDIGSWDVSNVTNMRGMFSSIAFFIADPVPFNQDISYWDVSNVTNMRGMFSGSLFNQDIGSWDVSSVTDMYAMFSSLNLNYMGPIGPFNQDIGSWDVGNVTNMGFMFFGSLFNQNIGSWDVDNVIECTNFSFDTPQWVLPKPDFTNCNPDY